jgi:hypothetical protein
VVVEVLTITEWFKIIRISKIIPKTIIKIYFSRYYIIINKNNLIMVLKIFKKILN